MISEVMRSPRFHGEGAITTEEKPVPSPGPGELLVQVKANALCGSERGQFFGGSSVTPGHEAAGTVAAAGPGTSTPVGTPGVIFLMDYCGECRSCALGFTNQCYGKRADMGFNRDGGYGPYMLVHENIFFPVDANLSHTEATLLLDIMGTGGHALRRGQLVHPDVTSLLIMGAGPIGLGILAMSKIMLGKEMPVYIADFSDYRLDLAGELGGIPLHLKNSNLTAILSSEGRAAIDLAVDTSGKGTARRSALDALDKRGVLVCVGHGEGLDLDVSRDLIGPERAVLGSEYFTFNELPGNLALLREHRAYFNRIITHRFGVDEITVAFETFWAGSTGKVIVEQ